MTGDRFVSYFCELNNSPALQRQFDWLSGLYCFNKSQCTNHACRMERQLVVGLVCLELQDGGLGTQYSALEQVDSGEDFIIGHRTLHQVVVVSADQGDGSTDPLSFYYLFVV